MSVNQESSSVEQPKVSCLMVTANRKNLAKRAVECFRNQSYTNKELVVVDDGIEDYAPLFKGLPADQIKYVKLEKEPDFVLGKLRNRSLEEASGDYLVQWDDDDWYHKDRIKIQAQILDQGYDACCLSSALMHLDTEEFMDHPYVGVLPNGIPGSIMHRNNSEIRYPETRRAEDTVYLNEWMEKRYFKLDDSFNHLFLRAYHGNNTWEKEHFRRRIRNSPLALIQYIWHAVLKRDLFSHPRFQLSVEAEKAFNEYTSLSKELELL
ncbi:MAG: glycosyltransferase family 2 protein [Balneolaceae bacterium]|nr:glycosyltransferase family 2 protein [Balneolaceae bacterium]MBO6547421.1 glycosyltransferase family 2 protein [Balneolaceae bacterium]MBO6647632.1 glycosyltransferase family 2 protein [Balneolaceae bacterium]